MVRQGPPRTDGERMVWAAAYAASWDAHGVHVTQYPRGGEERMTCTRQRYTDGPSPTSTACTCRRCQTGLWCRDGKRAVLTRESSKCSGCGQEAWQHHTVPPCEEGKR